MDHFKKSRDALSVLESELDILMYELTPCDWAGLSLCVDKLKAYFHELEVGYSDE